MNKVIFIIDEDAKILRLLSTIFSSAGFTPQGFFSGTDAIRQVNVMNPSIIISDIMMAEMDGYNFLERIRTFSNIPLIFLTEMSDIANKVKGLNLGADDYITKPFAPDELLARTNAVLRRAGGQTHHDVYKYDSLIVDFSNQRVMAGGNEVKLTVKEMRLLTLMAKNSGKVFLHKNLLSAIWGSGSLTNLEYLRVTINRIRTKLQNAGVKGELIKTYSGVGYMLTDPNINK